MAKDIVIIIGSSEDIQFITDAVKFLEKIGIAYDLQISHPQLGPNEFYRFCTNIHNQGYKVVITASGDCPSIASSVAALTPLPVICIPIVKSHPVGGLDAILTSLQMPPGVPVATVSTNTSQNAALLAIQMLSISHPSYMEIVIAYKKKLSDDIKENHKQSLTILNDLLQ